MEEPAVGFLRGGDFDDGAVVPIGRGELAELVDAIDDRVEDAAVPAAGLARRGRRDRCVCHARPSTSHGILRVAADVGRCRDRLRASSTAPPGRRACARRAGRRRGRGRGRRRCGRRSAECGVRSVEICRFRASLRTPHSRTPHSCSTICSGVPAATTLSARLARLGAEVDDPVGRLDHVEIVLDHDDRVAQVDQAIAARRAAWRGRRSAGRSSARRAGRACGRCRAGTARRPASRAGLRRRRASARAGRASGSRGRRRTAFAGCGGSSGCSSNSSTASPHDMASTSAIDLAVERDGERLGVVALAAARLALDPHVGQEVHLDALLAVAFARLAAAAGHVEAEPPGRVAAELRLRAAARTAGGSGRTRRCTWPGSRSACCRAAADRRGSPC